MMTHQKNAMLDTDQLAMILDKVPIGITVIDLKGRILYYNAYCAKFVDRKPEYIGRDIRFCHKHRESTEKIESILYDLSQGKTEEYSYETKRGEHTLVVTVSPFDIDGKPIGFIQSFSAKR